MKGIITIKASSIILFVALTFGFGNLYGQHGNIKLLAKNIRSDKGLIRLALYNHADQFPHDPGRKYEFPKNPLDKGELHILLKDIPPGRYAISILDDEDGNDKMKFNLLRIPKEGYGFSNNVSPGLKSPGFDECSFLIEDEDIRLEIEIRYFREKS
jgi:uncharacterized protein (DUF2141 family)